MYIYLSTSVVMIVVLYRGAK